MMKNLKKSIKLLTVLPMMKNIRLEMRIIQFDINEFPQLYLKNMIYINKELEKLSTLEKTHKLFHILPLRTSLIPSYIQIDSQALIGMFPIEGKSIYRTKMSSYKRRNMANLF